MQTIFDAVKKIAIKIDHAIHTEDLGYEDSTNTSGEDQLKLDVKSDYIVEQTMREVSIVKALISEEKEGVLPLHSDGKYTVCYDPLDGSSLADVNLSVGTIVGIYKGEPKGENIVAAAYVVYGPRIELVTAVKGEAPRHYRAQDELFNFVGEITLNPKGKLNAPGGTQKHWYPYHKAFIDDLFAQGYRLRYSGGMVPDLHQILLKGGGLFSYPGTSDNPDGKLRALFEVIPFALIFECAGGSAIDDNGEQLLAHTPLHPHGTTPCFFGSREEVTQMAAAYEAAR